MTASESNAAVDDAIASRVRASFEQQPAMALIGARLLQVRRGFVEIELPYRGEITQQHGFVHAGVLGAALDSACGYAALSVMPPQAGVLTIEYKMNCLAPAIGERFRVLGQVRKAGRTIVLSEGEALAVGADGREKLVATMTGTMMTVLGRDGVKD